MENFGDDGKVERAAILWSVRDPAYDTRRCNQRRFTAVANATE
jgi:hypothetical protein